jgi:AhpD family alkylhydroperoxidase
MRLSAILFLLFSLSHASAKPFDTYKDIKDTLGAVPSFFSEYPTTSVEGAWLDMKGNEFNPYAVIPAKYKEMIALAVAGQVPCRSCAYFHSQLAKVYKASNEELKEAVAMAGFTRRWSSFLAGVQIDQGEFRTETDQILLFQNKHRNLQAMEVEPKTAEIPLNNQEAVYKDMRANLGMVPNFIAQYPKGSLAGGWREMKELAMGQSTGIPRKYKDLIGLAVAAQIPCQYSIYYHTQSAIMQGATKEELEETAALAGSVQAWSSVVNGLLIDERKMKAEVDQVANYIKSKMPRKVGSSN